MRKSTRTNLAHPPAFVRPQLPASVRVSPDGPGWLHEIKYDGYRLFARVDEGEIRLLTRGNLDWTSRFQTTANEIAGWKLRNALFDGEIVAFDEKGIPSFQKLQQALTRREHKFLYYMVFDCLHLNGRNMMREPLEMRKTILQETIPPAAVTIRYSDHINDVNGAEIFEHARKLGVEGIVSKRAKAHYRSGRSNAWVKAKCANQEEFVISGFFGREHVASLLVGFYDKNRLIYTGKVGTGFTQQESERLFAQLSPLRIEKSPFAATPNQFKHARWVNPALVASIAYNNWTVNGLLRDASYRGIREDKPAQEVVREAVLTPSSSTRTHRIRNQLRSRPAKNIE